jgi:hypothetical protein
MWRLITVSGLQRRIGRGCAFLAFAAMLFPASVNAQSWSWKTETIDKVAAFNAKIATDATGNLHVSYSNAAGDIKYGFRHSGSSQWFTMVVDHFGSASNIFTNLAIDQQGNPHLCYTPGVIKHAYWDGEKWQIEQIAPGSGVISYSCSIAVAPDGTPHLTWYQVDYGEQINYLHMRHAVRQEGAWLVRTVDFDAETGKWNSMVLDSEGRPHLSYSAYHLGLKYAYWTGKAWAPIMVDARGRKTYNYRGMGNALALDHDGKALISYFDIDDRTLNFAWEQAKGWNIQTIDSLSPGVGISWVAWRSSLVLDQHGFPHICYGDFGALKLAHWDGKQWHIQVIASGAADQYRYSAIAIDHQDKIYVIYPDSLDGALKAAMGTLSGDQQVSNAENKRGN